MVSLSSHFSAPSPAGGRANVLGEINGVELEMAIMEAIINPALTDDQGAIIMADITKIKPELGTLT